MKAIAFVPARGGSKSIPKKNIRDFCGRPLIWWTLSALQGSPSIGKIVVATDDQAIRDVVMGFGFQKCEVYDRDPRNARDDSSTESVVLEYLAKSNLPADTTFFLVQATSPGTRAGDFELALTQLQREGADSLLTCSREKIFIWSETGVPVNYDPGKRPRRQEFKGVLVENGAFYISKAGQILRDENRLSGRKAIYEMTGPLASIDLDEEVDWIIAEALFRASNA